MLQTPVTQKMWKDVMGDNPSHFQGDDLPLENFNWFKCAEFCNKLTLREKNLRPCYYSDPEFRILYEGGEGEVYCDQLADGYRLPTEAEWEYACRAGTTTHFHYGNSLDSTMANFEGRIPYGKGKMGEYRNRTTTVKSFRPNDWKLYDMHGNLWEWCWDRFDSDYYGNSPVDDPKGPESGSDRVLLGCCWGNGAVDCRSGCREGGGPADGAWSRGDGFRVVRRPS